jgi:polyhydroxybutyrate depolymerase
MKEAVNRAERRISVHGVERHYLACFGGDKPPSGLPVVMMLHGAGDTARGAMFQTGWAQKAVSDNFIAVFPEALRGDMRRPPSFDDNPQMWNDCSGRGWSYENKISDVEFLSAVIDDLSVSFAADAGKIFLTGFSNGASMAFCAAAVMPDKFAAIAPVAGHCWAENAKPFKHPVPLLYMVGGADKLNPVDGGDVKVPWGIVKKPPVEKTFRKWAALCGCSGAEPRLWREGALVLKDFSPCPGGESTKYCEIAGLGHHWAGGHNALGEEVAGPKLDKPDATALIWDFFKSMMRL